MIDPSFSLLLLFIVRVPSVRPFTVTAMLQTMEGVNALFSDTSHPTHSRNETRDFDAMSDIMYACGWTI